MHLVTSSYNKLETSQCLANSTSYLHTIYYPVFSCDNTLTLERVIGGVFHVVWSSRCDFGVSGG
jgi:hypothetical protein